MSIRVATGHHKSSYGRKEAAIHHNSMPYRTRKVNRRRSSSSISRFRTNNSSSTNKSRTSSSSSNSKSRISISNPSNSSPNQSGISKTHLQCPRRFLSTNHSRLRSTNPSSFHSTSPRPSRTANRHFRT